MRLPLAVRCRLVLVLLAGLLMGGWGLRTVAQEISRTEAERLGHSLTFELGLDAGWKASPPETVFRDEQVVHSGRGAVRLERGADSPQPFSGVVQSLPMDFAGKEVELRGFIRLENVSDFAAFWMRVDGDTPNLAFDSLQRLRINGTADWAEYSVKVPVHPQGRRLFFGFLLSGSGKAWADDLQLLVDGKPIWEAPEAVRVLTVLDRDQEFAAGSGIAMETLTPVQVENLATLGRVWGFLKYHHPKVRAGERHWDFELFRIMPAVLAAADRPAAGEVLAGWVDRLGPVAPPATPAGLEEKELHLRPELDWLHDESRLGAGLSRRLVEIHRNRPAGAEQFYVGMHAGVGNPRFDHESSYSFLKSPDAGYRLLALFRFWNIIRYWFPYRDLVEGDWDATLVEFIPRIALAATADDYQLQLIALITRVSDTHANLWSSLRVRPPVGEFQLPVTVRFVEGRAVIAGLPAGDWPAVAGLEVGDVIERIEGVAVEQLVREWGPYYAASNEPTRLRDIARALTKGPAGEVELDVRRNEEVFTVKGTRVPVGKLARVLGRTHDRPGDAFQMLSPEVAYLKLSSVKQPEAKAYVERALGAKGWVLDLRNYPSAFMVFALGGHLVGEPSEFARFTGGDLRNPGAFRFGKPLSLQPATPRYEGKVVILVDEVTQSSAEYTTMAFRVAPGAKVIGSTTAAADGNASQIPLPGGLGTMISGIGVFYPDKRPTQRIGIIPDMEVKPTIAGIRAGRDEVLEAALREILGPAVSEDEIARMARAPEGL